MRRVWSPSPVAFAVMDAVRHPRCCSGRVPASYQEERPVRFDRLEARHLETAHQPHETRERVAGVSMEVGVVEVQGPAWVVLLVGEYNGQGPSRAQHPLPLDQHARGVDIVLEVVPSDDGIECAVAKGKSSAVARYVGLARTSRDIANPSERAAGNEIDAQHFRRGLAIPTPHFERSTADVREDGEPLRVMGVVAHRSREEPVSGRPRRSVKRRRQNGSCRSSTYREYSAHTDEATHRTFSGGHQCG